MIRSILKYSLAVAVLLAVAGAAKAQNPIKFGVKGGITIQNLDMNRLKLGGYNLSTDPEVGFQIGFMSRINLILFHLQPEINFNFNSYGLDAHTNGNDKHKSTVRNTTIEVPVLLSKKILPFLQFNIGPVFNVYNESKFTNSSDDIFNSIRTNKSTVTYAAGVALDVASVNIDLRYNGEFRRSRQNLLINNDSDKFNTKLSFWSLAVGYFF